MGTTSLPILAGMVSTTVFATSMMPMLVKAARTRDLSSYSLGSLVLANIGNAVHSVYVFHLPPGPIWFLHGFYLLTSAVMLCWWVRYRPVNGGGDCAAVTVSHPASDVPGDEGRRRPCPPGRAPAGYRLEQTSCAVADSPGMSPYSPRA